MIRCSAVAVLLVACAVESDAPDPFGLDAGTAAAPTGTGADSGGGSTGADSGDGEDGSPASDPTNAVDDDGGSGGVAGCGAGQTCITPPPQGWLGPVAVHFGDEDTPPPDCGGGYPTADFSLYSGFEEAAPATCECVCELQNAGACQAWAYEADAGCTTFANFVQINQPCHAMNIAGGVYYYNFAQGQAFCQKTVNEVIDPPSWDASISTCKVEALGDACGDGGVCIPEAPPDFSPAVCIYRQGEEECPAGSFSQRSTFYSGVDDDRHCSQCTCGAAPQSSCDAPLEVFASADCTGAALGSANPNGCTDLAGGQSVAIAYPEVGCPVDTPSVAEGAATPSGAFTYCCQE